MCAADYPGSIHIWFLELRRSCALSLHARVLTLLLTCFLFVKRSAMLSAHTPSPTSHSHPYPTHTRPRDARHMHAVPASRLVNRHDIVAPPTRARVSCSLAAPALIPRHTRVTKHPLPPSALEHIKPPASTRHARALCSSALGGSGGLFCVWFALGCEGRG